MADSDYRSSSSQWRVPKKDLRVEGNNSVLKQHQIPYQVPFQSILLAVWPRLNFLKLADTIFIEQGDKPSLWCFTDMQLNTQLQDITHIAISEVIRTFCANIMRQRTGKETFSNDDLAEMLSNEELSKLHICFGLYGGRRQLFTIRDLCKPEIYL